MSPKPDMAESVRAELAGVVPLMRTEPGCIRYDLHESSDETPRFLFYEIWESETALALHGDTKHLQAMQAATADMVISVKVETWTAVDVLPA